MPATTRRLDQRRQENAHEGRFVMMNVKPDLDAVIIGAGFSGMYMLHSLRDKLDLKVTVFEAGGGVGRQWDWNRYPAPPPHPASHPYCFTLVKKPLPCTQWSQPHPPTNACLPPSLPPSPPF